MTAIKTNKLHPRNTEYVSLFFVIFLFPGIVMAKNELITIGGLNEYQQSLADSIADICPKLDVLKEDNRLDETQLQLSNACSAMIATSRSIQGEPDVGLSEFSIGNITTAEQYQNALSQIAHEETATHGTSFTETSQAQVGNISNRLRNLRKGGAKFFNGFSLNLKKYLVPFDFISQLTDDSNSSLFNLNSGFSYYLNGTLSYGDKDSTSREDGFDFQSKGITLGADYQLGSNGFFGAALGYSNLESDIDNNTSNDGMDNQGYSLSFYGTHFKKSAYINGVITLGTNNITNQRTVPLITDETDDNLTNFTVSGVEQLKGETSAKTFGLSISSGIDSNIGALTISRYAQVDYLHVSIDSYDETGNSSPLLLSVDKELINSFSSVIGFQASLATSTSFGVMTDIIRLQWHHEFEDDSRKINANYFYDPFEEKSTFNAPTDDPDRDYFTVGIGSTTVLPLGVQAFVFFEKTFGLENINNQSIVFGVRKESF